MKNVPILLVSEETKRKQAKEKVLEAVRTIKEYGSLAGMTDRTLFEFSALMEYITKETKRAIKHKIGMGRSFEKREIQANNT